MINAQLETRRFSVGEHPHIVVNNDLGTIRVYRGYLSNEVAIQTTKRNRIFSSAPGSVQISYEQDGEGKEIAITTRRENLSLANSTTEVDIDIAVPGHVDLNLTTRAGTITVSDLFGQMILISNAGTIIARHCLLTGNSHLSTEAGTVHFEGSLDPHGAYQFITRLGSVHVTLLNSTSFHVDASTNLGSITTDIPGLMAMHPNLLNSEVHGEIGDLPRATLALQSKFGSIDLQVWAAESIPGMVSENQYALG